jgi:hypothetical protein
MACSNNKGHFVINCEANDLRPPFIEMQIVCEMADLVKSDERALRHLWNFQVMPNKKKYSLVHLRFMREHIAGHLENLGIIV